MAINYSKQESHRLVIASYNNFIYCCCLYQYSYSLAGIIILFCYTILLPWI